VDDQTAVVRAIPLFVDLDEPMARAISSIAQEIEVPAGHVLMREGERGDAFYAIVDGSVRIERGDKPIRTMTSGGVLGEMALLETGIRSATATCETSCRLLVFDADEFDRMLLGFPAVYRRLRATVSRRTAGRAGHAPA
jgi:CRP-like cAMP-binding protein